jgi:hypothetical protein
MAGTARVMTYTAYNEHAIGYMERRCACNQYCPIYMMMHIHMHRYIIEVVSHIRKRKGRPATDVEFSGAVPALPSGWDAEGRWTTIFEGKWYWDAEHINVKEGRTTLMLLRRLGRNRRARHHRVLGIGDNLVSLCGFEKGRAKSWCLNALCRRSASYQIATRIRWQLRHLESKRNPCDAGSRRHEERRPAAPLARARPSADDGWSSARPPALLPSSPAAPAPGQPVLRGAAGRGIGPKRPAAPLAPATPAAGDDPRPEAVVHLRRRRTRSSAFSMSAVWVLVIFVFERLGSFVQGCGGAGGGPSARGHPRAVQRGGSPDRGAAQARSSYRALHRYFKWSGVRSHEAENTAGYTALDQRGTFLVRASWNAVHGLEHCPQKASRTT